MNHAVNMLSDQTVGKTGYIYCINSNGIFVVHPMEGGLGNDFSHIGYIQSQIKTKEGYLEYEWKNPGESKVRPKAIYMTYFEPWDWIISVSSYASEFNRLISCAHISLKSWHGISNYLQALYTP